MILDAYAQFEERSDGTNGQISRRDPPGTVAAPIDGNNAPESIPGPFCDHGPVLAQERAIPAQHCRIRRSVNA